MKPCDGLSRLLDQGLNQHELAKLLGESRSTIAQWVAGNRLPTAEQRETIKKKLKIPASSWGRERAPEKKTKVEPSAEFLGMTTAQVVEKLRQNALRQLWEAETSDLPLAMRNKQIESCNRQIMQIQKMTGENREITPNKIMNHPAWIAVWRTVLKSLEPWPEALRTLGEDLAKLGRAEQ